MQISALHGLFLQSKGVTTDTRNLLQGGMFFALKGDNFNGNSYAVQAIEAGCAFAIVDEDIAVEDDRIIKVDNTLITLQKLANFHRNTFDIPVIGITGSNGKTTSKELLTAVLSKKFNTLSTIGNFNNHLGVPFTLLRLTAEHELAIIEMGANKPGDIQELVEIAEPTHGVITNIGAAHIEGFGSIEGVIKTKGELYDFIAEQNGVLFYNGQDLVLNSILPDTTYNIDFGETQGLVRGTLTGQSPYVSFKWSANTYQSPVLNTNLVGRYNFTNFLLAITIGVYFEVDSELINKAIEDYIPSNNRSQIKQTDKNTLIVDCYNANATSMTAALESFVEMNGANKLAILGDMLELGAISTVEHQKIIDFLVSHKLNAILVGAEMAKVAGELKHYDSWKSLVEGEKLTEIEDALILLKGSRGIKLEELIAYL